MYVQRNKPDGYDYILGRKPSSKLKLFQSEFDLVTCILYPSTMPIHATKFTSHKIASTKKSISIKKLADTKGYLCVDVIVNGVEITIVNIHLPFEDAEFSKINFRRLYETFKSRPNVILFGDYNSRSKVDDTCLSETRCEVAFKKNSEHSVFALESALNLCTRTDNCAIEKRLLDYDYLNEVKPETMPDFKEATIQFLPSYKIDETGQYRLQKGSKRRLVGYADRILVKGNLDLMEGTYKKGHCLGNDHFPVLLEVGFGKTRKTRKS
jgi:endonuclease/exonuclease/phosphatase family metal-dependent hydrolase